MGGVVIEAGEHIATNNRLSLTAEGIRLLSFLDRLPNVKEHQIRDKSKADGLAKFLVVLQAGWMIIQTIGRVQQNLPVTLLEMLVDFSIHASWIH